jgi:hypothetical protein
VSRRVAQAGPDQMTLIPTPRESGELVAATCALMTSDPVHSSDQARITTAILADGYDNGGEINPNRVRAALQGPYGLDVYPAMVGATYQSLIARGYLRFSGWTISDDARGGNRGKPARTYTLTLNDERNAL